MSAVELNVRDLVSSLEIIWDGRQVAFRLQEPPRVAYRYVIQPTGVEYGRFNGAETDRWYLHGQLISRDGDRREFELGRNRRRSFEIDGLRGFMEAPDGD